MSAIPSSGAAPPVRIAKARPPAAPAAVVHQPPAPAKDPETGPLGMWIFLASEVLFFGGLFFAYLYGRTHWPAGFAQASRHTDVVLGTVNTAVLLTSSALVALAHACEAHGDGRRWTARLLAATAVLGVAFLAIKGVEYHHEWREHLFPIRGFALTAPGAGLFFVLYFVMTGLHAVHLAIGASLLAVYAWAKHAGVAWADARHIEVVALYWHFVDVVWIFLYPLLYLVQRHA